MRDNCKCTLYNVIKKNNLFSCFPCTFLTIIKKYWGASSAPRDPYLKNWPLHFKNRVAGLDY